MSLKPYNQSLPFDETYAWENFITLVKKLVPAESMVFYGFERKLRFRAIKRGLAIITSEKLSNPEECDLLKQRRFEKVFMSAVLKNSKKHLHRFERSATRHPDHDRQIYRCIDPDCTHYNQAQFIVGKRAACHKCGNEIIVERDQLKNAFVVGLCCGKSNKARQFRAAATLMENVLLPTIDESDFEILGTEADEALTKFLKEGVE